MENEAIGLVAPVDHAVADLVVDVLVALAGAQAVPEVVQEVLEAVQVGPVEEVVQAVVADHVVSARTAWTWRGSRLGNQRPSSVCLSGMGR